MISLFFIFFALPAIAEPGFYRPADLPQEWIPQNLEQVVSASARMSAEFLTEDWGCSGTFISNEGHYLTATHCIWTCPFENLRATPRTFPPFYTFALHFRDRHKPVSCSSYSMKEIGAAKPKLIFIGDTYYMINTEHVLWAPEYIRKQTARLREDFAILKFETAQPTPCIRASDEDPLDGDRAWAIGFPRKTLRGALSSDGTERVSFGTVFDDIRKSESFQGAKFSEKQYRALVPLYKRESFLLADLDIFHGNSGGATFNEKGELTGVIVQFLGPRTGSEERYYQRYYRNTAVAHRVSYIKHKLEQTLGAAEAEKVFSCE